MSVRRPVGLKSFGVLAVAAVAAIFACDARDDASEKDAGPAPAFSAVVAPTDASTLVPRTSNATAAPAPVITTAPDIEPFCPPRQGVKTRRIPRAQLAAKIEAELQRKSLAGASVGIAVVSVNDGGFVFTRLGDTPLKVASNDKLLTSYAVLDILGPDFRFVTRVFARGALADGVLNGDLIVQGDGDPGDDTLDEKLAKPSQLDRIVAVVQSAGIRRVTGALVVDDTIFDREFIPSGWPKDQLTKEYCAPVAGFSLVQNLLTTRILPGKAVGDPASVRFEPDTGAFEVRNAVKTIAKTGKHEIGVPAPSKPGKVTVSGTTPFGAKPEPIRVPIADPPLTAGTHVKRALEKAGVAVAGTVMLADARTVAGGDVRQLGTVETSLQDRLRVMNKESMNSVAEHLYKRAGAALYGTGTAANGGKAVLATLQKHGIDPAGAISEDGSGMGRGNRFTPRQVARLLVDLYRSPHRSAFLDTLPVCGVDGTLKNRLDGPQYERRVRAKTGYITKVSTLSGFAQTDSGEVLAFSILINDFDVRKVSNAEMKDVQDDIARLLVDLEGSDS